MITARADFDETAPHIHAMIAPWAEKTSKRRGWQHLLVPSAYELLKSYEDAQTDIAENFAPLNLARGQRRSEERRRAEEGGRDQPEYRENQCSHVWREAEAAQLRKRAKDLKEREHALAGREAAQRQREAEIETRERATAESESAFRKAQVTADAKAARLDEREAVNNQVETLLDVAASQGTVGEAKEDEAPLTARIRRKLGRMFASLSPLRNGLRRTRLPSGWQPRNAWREKPKPSCTRCMQLSRAFLCRSSKNGSGARRTTSRTQS